MLPQIRVWQPRSRWQSSPLNSTRVVFCVSNWRREIKQPPSLPDPANHNLKWDVLCPNFWVTRANIYHSERAWRRTQKFTSLGVPAKCGLCGGPHPANYKGWEYYHNLTKNRHDIQETQIPNVKYTIAPVFQPITTLTHNQYSPQAAEERMQMQQEVEMMTATAKTTSTTTRT
jgi:hypothetical protein